LVANPHARDAAAVATELGVDPTRGLDTAEVVNRRARFGRNTFGGRRGGSLLQSLIDQFKNALIVLLLVAAGISLYAGDALDAVVILAITVVNALIGATQESRARSALDALQSVNPPEASVRRDGEVRRIAAVQLVPGDLVLLRSGDLVPADGRLLSSVGLEIDESNLTGESLPTEKNASLLIEPRTALADRVNMAYLGTAVRQGNAELLVTATGLTSEMGRLALAVEQAGPRPTPLQRQLAWLTRVLSTLAVAAALLVFALGLARGQTLHEMAMISLSLAVAAVPEALPAVMSIVLAIGVQRMAARQAIVRRLEAVEALGSATVICTDKTGTLTLGEMRVTAAWAGGRVWHPADGADQIRPLVVAASLCNNADGQSGGDPTERALLLLAREAGLDVGAIRADHPRVAEIPFSSERKWMLTEHAHDGQRFAIIKGAPDVVLGHCAWTGDGVERRDAEIHLARFAGEGLRVLALARFEGEVHGDLPSGMALLGLVALADPPRAEARAALAAAKAAGVRTVMITGDHPATAISIGEQLGLDGGGVLTGPDLEEMGEAELRASLERTNIYARVAPAHKVDIVRALQAEDEVVGMTGDGANDAPALRLADIGVAMGIRGTDVAKEAAGIVLADDNYSTIVAAIEEGRTVYANLRKSIFYLLSGNLGEVLTILGAIAIGLPLPFHPIQILWVNLLTDALPALALAMEPPEPDQMGRPPRRPGERFLPSWSIALIAVPSVLLGGVSIGAFAVALGSSGDLATAQSAAFLTLVIGHLAIGWGQRSTLASSLAMNPLKNPLLILATAVAALSFIPILYTDLGREVFHTASLAPSTVLLSMLLAPIPLLGAEGVKAYLRRR
jgi:Ca2+-transporting ATPase